MVNAMSGLQFGPTVNVSSTVANALNPAPEIDETTLKRRFALEILRTPENAFAAMLRVFPGDTSLAITRMVQWRDDPEVKQFIAELAENTPAKNLLPTKEDTARMIFQTVSDLDRRMEMRDRLRGFELFARMMGYIEKEGTSSVNVSVTNTTNKVMVVKDHGNDDDWERKAERQQANLILEARGTSE